jgi:hypothetical protein
MARPNQAAVEQIKRLIADIKIGQHGIPNDLMEALIFDIADRSAARSMSTDERAILIGTLSHLKEAYREGRDVLKRSREENVSWWLFTVAQLGYFAGSLCPDKIFTEGRTADPTAKRIQNNAHWVQPFNKAIRQAHNDGLKGKPAIAKAIKTLKGINIPVGNDALRDRERELRTGKKRK